MERIAEMTRDTTWSKWITGKFEDFKATYTKERGGEDRGALMAYARLFDAPHQVVRAWMRPGAQPPRDATYRNRLIELYGDEFYIATGTPAPPDNSLSSSMTANISRAAELLRGVPPEKQQEVIELIENYLQLRGWVRIK